MAGYTHEEQVEIVRKALALETAIAVGRAEIELVRGQAFERFPAYGSVFDEKPPGKPRRVTCQAPAPVEAAIPKPPKAAYGVVDHLRGRPLWVALLASSVGLSVVALRGALGATAIGLLLSLACTLSFPAWCIGFTRSFLDERKRKNQELANSPEYLQSVALANQQAADRRAEAELQARQEQARLDAQYEADLKRYNEVLLPSYERAVADNKREYEEMREEYERDKAKWEATRGEAVALLERDVTANGASLDELYGSAGIISLHYRQIPLLEWLYDDMRTSDHDIRYATELLDRDRQRVATVEAGARTADAVDRMRDDVTMLQGVQMQGLRNLEAVSSDILHTSDDIYTTAKKVLFHQRVSTADVGLREWRHHKAKKTAKRDRRGD